MTLVLKDACGQCMSGLTTTMNFEKGDAIAHDGDPTVTGCSRLHDTHTLRDGVWLHQPRTKTLPSIFIGYVSQAGVDGPVTFRS